MTDDLALVATQKSEQNRAAVDPWTLVHLSSGLASGLVDVPFRWAVTAAVIYEVAEQAFERDELGRRFFKTHGPESLPNAAVDVAAFALGHWLGQRWNRGG
jgi:hypothetical protein